MKTIKVKGRKVEVWEKSFRIFNRDSQLFFCTPVLFIGRTPDTAVIAELCEALDSAHEAGKESAKKELRIFLGIERN